MKIKRVLAYVIDWIVVFAIGIFFSFMGPKFNLEYLRYPSIHMFSAYGVIFSIFSFLFLPLIKDCLFGHASLGKWLFKLKIVSEESYEKPSIFNIMIRNITFYLPIIEFLFLLLNNGKTIGDLVSKTTVIEHQSGDSSKSIG